MKKFLLSILLATTLSGCHLLNNINLPTGTSSSQSEPKFSAKDYDLDANFALYKNIFDQYLGETTAYRSCQRYEKDYGKKITQTGEAAVSSSPYGQICFNTNERILASKVRKREFMPEAGHIPFLKRFKEREYNEYQRNLSEKDKELIIDFTIAHELAHMYEAKLLKNREIPRIRNTFVFKGASNKTTFNFDNDTNNRYEMLRGEMLADLLAITVMKERYGRTKALESFVETERYFRLIESSWGYKYVNEHFLGLIYVDGIDLALSFSLSPEGLDLLVKTAELLTAQSYLYLNPVYDEKITEQAFEWIARVGRYCKQNYPNRIDECLGFWAMDKRLTQMSWEEFKAEYDREYLKLTHSAH